MICLRRRRFEDIQFFEAYVFILAFDNLVDGFLFYIYIFTSQKLNQLTVNSYQLSVIS